MNRAKKQKSVVYKARQNGYVGRTTKAPNPSSSKTNTKEKRVIFELILYKTSDIDESRQKVEELEANQQYQIEVTVREDSDGEVLVGEDLRIRIDSNETLPSAKLLQNEYFTYTEIAINKKFVEIRIPPTFPNCTLKLSVCPAGPGLQQYANSTKLKIQGTYQIIDEDWFKTLNLSINPPDQVVVLAITEEKNAGGQIICKIQGWSYKDTVDGAIILPRDSNLQMKASLVAPNLEEPDNVLRNFRLLSEGIPKNVQEWLGDLFSQNLNKLCFAIIDDTTLEIPWEMISIKEKYLGIEAQVVHWLPSCSGINEIPLHWTQETHKGPIIAYRKNDTARLQNYRIEEKQELEKYTLYDNNDINTWIDCLNDFQNEIGLIYASGFTALFSGRYQKTSNEEINKNEMVEAYSLVNIGHKESRSPVTVFINASDSGRYTSNKDYISFVERLLLPWKSCYIGVLGSIDPGISLEVVKHLLEQPEEDVDTPIAERLWKLRKTAFEELKQAMDKQNDTDIRECKKRLVYIFLYVYYGNPLTSLRLQKRETALC